MKLTEMKVNDYLELLKSKVPAPGGGSVSALSGAQGVALILMVADLTIGKEKYADYEDICCDAKEKALPLYKALINGIDKDTEAYCVVADARKMSKCSDEEKAVRKEAIAKSTILATQVPFETMEQGYQALKLIEGLIGNSNPNASSDLGVAAINLSTCVQGAWLNVLINLPGIKGEAMASKFKTEGEKIFKASKELSDKLYEAVRISLL